MEKKKCEWCGKEYIPVNYRQKYCGTTCQRARQTASWREKNKEFKGVKKTKKKPAQIGSTLTEDAIKAREQGLTYGQYIARKQSAARLRKGE